MGCDTCAVKKQGVLFLMSNVRLRMASLFHLISRSNNGSNVILNTVHVVDEVLNSVVLVQVVVTPPGAVQLKNCGADNIIVSAKK